MNGYGSHTFKLVNSDGKPVYCKFHFKTDQVYIYMYIYIHLRDSSTNIIHFKHSYESNNNTVLHNEDFLFNICNIFSFSIELQLQK